MKSKTLAAVVTACLIILNSLIVSAQCINTRIMPLGDSITAGYGEVLDPAYIVGYRQFLWDTLLSTGYTVDFVGSQNYGYAVSGFESNNEGHPGWTAAQVASNIYQWLVNNPADIILLHIGTNDVVTSTADVETILNEIDRYKSDYNTQITVVLAQIINRVETVPDTYDAGSVSSLFNINLRNLAISRIASGDRIFLVDMEHAFDYPDDLYVPDLVHPTSGGYAKMANVWFLALGEILFTCTGVGNQAPNGVIASPSMGMTINAGESVSFSGAGSDPDGNLPLSYLWQLVRVRGFRIRLCRFLGQYSSTFLVSTALPLRLRMLWGFRILLRRPV